MQRKKSTENLMVPGKKLDISQWVMNWKDDSKLVDSVKKLPTPMKKKESNKKD